MGWLLLTSLPVNTGGMNSSPAVTASFTAADLPPELRALVDTAVPFTDPPRQGRTSRVVFARDLRGNPVVIKRAVGPYVELMRREAQVLSVVHPLGVPAPELLLFVERSGWSGVEGWLVTRRLLGVTLDVALQSEGDPVRRAALLTDFGRTLARVHGVAPAELSSGDWLEQFMRVAKVLNPLVDRGHLERLRKARPKSTSPTLIHGDLFLDNVLTLEGRVTGVIDWAFADVGDARFDVAVASREWSWGDWEAFAAGYGSSGRLGVSEEAFFVEVALLF